MELLLPAVPGLGLDLNPDVVREHPYETTAVFDVFKQGWEKRIGVRDPRTARTEGLSG